jgi:uncharacterized protein YhdP
MGTAVLRLGVGTDAWNTQVDSTVGFASNTLIATSRISAKVSLAFAKLRLAKNLNVYNKMLSDLVDKIRKSVEKAERGEGLGDGQGQTPTPDQLLTAIRSLEYLYDASKRMYAQAAAKRLTNNSLMAASLRSIDLRADELLDIADWFHAARVHSQDELKGLFSRARTELINGETVDLSQVR